MLQMVSEIVKLLNRWISSSLGLGKAVSLIAAGKTVKSIPSNIVSAAACCKGAFLCNHTRIWNNFTYIFVVHIGWNLMMKWWHIQDNPNTLPKTTAGKGMSETTNTILLEKEGSRQQLTQKSLERMHSEATLAVTTSWSNRKQLVSSHHWWQ